MSIIKFRIVRKDGTIVADKLLPSEVFKLIKNGTVSHPQYQYHNVRK